MPEVLNTLYNKNIILKDNQTKSFIDMINLMKRYHFHTNF